MLTKAIDFKVMNIKHLSLIIATAVLTASLSTAQTRTVEHEYSEFDAVSVSGGFKVTFVEQEGYNAKFKVSDALESYIQCYVKAGTLYIGVDEKSIPKEVRKSFKGNDSDGAVLEATVYVPALNSITLSDNATFSSAAELNAADFSLNMSGSSCITDLNVNALSAVISVSKKSKLSSIHVKAGDKVTLNAEGNAGAALEYSSKTLEINNAGSAGLAVKGQCGTLSVCTAGSAGLSLSGSAGTLNVTGKGNSSVIDAAALLVDDVNVSLDGAELTVAPGKNLSLDLGKGACVCYSGDPMVKIVRIQNATVTRK